MYDKIIPIGTSYGYKPNPSKCKVVVHPNQVAEAENYFNGCHQYSFKISVEEHYLGGFVGTNEARDNFVKSKVEDWVFGV